jgi:hypothetical protein
MWSGWYDTPNSRWISVATRAVVQTAHAQPNASGPCVSNIGNRARCSSDRRRGAPGLLRCRRLSGPPTDARLSHWHTAPRLTPSASAIRTCRQPCRCSSRARNRLNSRQSFGVTC